MLHPNSRTPLRDTPLRRNLGPRHLTARTRLVTATNAEKCESRVTRLEDNTVSNVGWEIEYNINRAIIVNVEYVPIRVNTISYQIMTGRVVDHYGSIRKFRP
ncbi:hypothetical protein NS506_01814 [Nocardia seriolae]|uniref:Uncharacterized protein n=1 Tax=Nocardia seriolae TaxID=37332 RepID=A0ABC8APD9_9NOCA|nr:hypothetical protein NS506_01814 [Nocardia seriolae]